ncbi:MAG: replication-associated recombination protein A [Nitriliruptorales bacterium]|nr:replication-associated recombination protein A [Nitriliruptorales bacterium]
MSERLFQMDGEGSASASPSADVSSDAPLAARMRPRTLDEYVGQPEAVGEDTPLRRMLERGELTSLLLWGPPGSGKTSLASVVATVVDASWQELSAVTAGVKDVRRVIEEARQRQTTSGRRTILFIDEIHRFNKAQQDALLPAVENGWIVLVGATTENPFFEINAPLISRCQLLRLEPLDDGDVEAILDTALDDPDRGYGGEVTLTEDARRHLVAVADGDARAALNALEVAVTAADPSRPLTLTAENVTAAMRKFRYSRAGDEHYDQVSAFIKSLRGSDPDAAVYWLLRMIAGGEDPRFIARRMVIFASEDVGLAWEGGLPVAVAAFEALDRVGLPEARYALLHAAIALATAPKSNAVARALRAGTEAVREAGNAPVPPHLRDSHYAGASEIGHGAGYVYPHDHPDAFVPQQYLPDELAGTRFYEPTGRGDEGAVAERLAIWRAAPDDDADSNETTTDVQDDRKAGT